MCLMIREIGDKYRKTSQTVRNAMRVCGVEPFVRNGFMFIDEEGLAKLDAYWTNVRRGRPYKEKK